MNSLVIILIPVSSLTLLTLAVDTTTPLPEQAPAPNPKYIGREGNTTCIIIEAVITISIPYTKRDGRRGETNITVPRNASTSAECYMPVESKSQSIYIHFVDEQNYLSFEFEENGCWNEADVMLSVLECTPAAEGRRGYFLKKLGIYFIADRSLFPDMEWENGTVIIDSESLSSFLSVNTEQGYYMCNVTISLDIGETAKVDLDDLRFKAFIKDNSEEFGGEVTVCGTSTGYDFTLIVVGCVFVVVVLFGAIAAAVGYVITKRKYRSGYAQFNGTTK